MKYLISSRRTRGLLWSHRASIGTINGPARPDINLGSPPLKPKPHNRNPKSWFSLPLFPHTRLLY